MTTNANNRASLARLGLAGAAALLGAASVAGCQGKPKQDAAASATVTATAHGERFPAQESVRPIDRFVRVQSAAGARTDATLNAYHFDARGGLNSLGRQKLDLMLGDDGALPLVVCLDLSRFAAAHRAADTHSAPATAASPAESCRESVRVYLADRGLDEAQVQFRDGPNAADTHPARDGLRGLKALREETADASSSDTGTSVTNRSAAGAELFTNRNGQ